ncbi:hypothetical protein [uncultured Methylobacterium sp.]|jgi:hypothetical protein|nr:hypothetical protein [uncultured Methylobacterium sp.]
MPLDPAAPERRSAVPPLSLLRLGVGTRLGLAALLAAAVWGVIGWALA